MPEYSHIITWMPHGRSWKVLDSKAFAEEVMTIFFEYSNYESYVRLVNAWGFRRISTGPERNSYFHERFLRGFPHLMGKMRRLTKNDKRIKISPEDEPNFYNFPLPVNLSLCLSSSPTNDALDDALDDPFDGPLDDEVENTLNCVLGDPVDDASVFSWLDLLGLDSDDASLGSKISQLSFPGSKLTPTHVRSQSEVVQSAPSVPPVISFQPTSVMSFSAPIQPNCMKNYLGSKMNLGNIHYQMMMLQSSLQAQQRTGIANHISGLSSYKLNSSFLI